MSDNFGRPAETSVQRGYCFRNNGINLRSRLLKPFNLGGPDLRVSAVTACEGKAIFLPPLSVIVFLPP